MGFGVFDRVVCVVQIFEEIRLDFAAFFSFFLFLVFFTGMVFSGLLVLLLCFVVSSLVEIGDVGDLAVKEGGAERVGVFALACVCGRMYIMVFSWKTFCFDGKSIFQARNVGAGFGL